MAGFSDANLDGAERSTVSSGGCQAQDHRFELRQILGTNSVFVLFVLASDVLGISVGPHFAFTQIGLLVLAEESFSSRV